MTAAKTNERPGTRAQVKNVRMSATKARVVLDLVRNKSIDEAGAVLAYTERRAAEVIGKCLDSAVANAEHNDQIDPETLYVSACYADEGRTMYRWRPRARGRATRIRKRTCHITVIVSPMPAAMLAAEQAKREAIPGSRAARRRGQEAASRAERVAKSQQAATDEEIADDEIVDEELTDEAVTDEAVDDGAETTAVEPTEDTAEPTEDTAEPTEDEPETVEDEPETVEDVAEAADDAGAVDATAEIAEETEEVEDAADEADEESK